MIVIKDIAKRHVGLILSMVVLLGLIFTSYCASVSKTGGRFIYVIDDPYIHMALAKNFAKYGVWGVTKGGFNSLSSSITWPLILSGIYKIFGFSETAPLIMNIVSALALLCLFYFVLRKYTGNQLVLCAILIMFILWIPLLPPVFTGLEHVFHAFLSVLFMYFASILLCRNEIRIKDCYGIFFISLILMATRYEAMFLIFITAFLFILRKQWKIALILVCCGFIPIALYGIISISKGWYFFPNSVLLKGNLPQFSSWPAIIDSMGYLALKNIISQPCFYILIIISMLLLLWQLRKYSSVWRAETIMMVIFIAVMLMHLQFADTDWFTRYEVYFYSMGFTAIAVLVLQEISTMKRPVWDKKKILLYCVSVLLMIFIAAPLELRGRMYLFNIPKASTNIYSQQIQMSKFIKQYFQGMCVAINDIGAVNCFADIKCLDLYGLADREVAKAKLGNYYKSSVIDSIALINGAKIAIVYDKWYYRYGGIPSNWIKVGKWRVNDNVVCAEDTVTFYAIDPSYRDYLVKSFFEFSQKLPPGADYFLFNGQK